MFYSSTKAWQWSIPHCIAFPCGWALPEAHFRIDLPCWCSVTRTMTTMCPWQHMLLRKLQLLITVSQENVGVNAVHIGHKGEKVGAHCLLSSQEKNVISWTSMLFSAHPETSMGAFYVFSCFVDKATMPLIVVWQDEYTDFLCCISMDCILINRSHTTVWPETISELFITLGEYYWIWNVKMQFCKL